MEIKNLLEEVSKQNFNLNELTNYVINDPYIRKELITQLTINEDINVYYHIYYIIDKASKIKPDLFYEYWKTFEKLLKHQNSYQRNIGHWIIANLIKVDSNNLFDNIYNEYFNGIQDKKFMTALYCIRDSILIVKSKPKYIDYVTKLYLNIDKEVSFKEKQMELMKYDILCFFENVFEKTSYKVEIKEFILKLQNSLSPKTAKKAKEILKVI